MCVCVCVCLIWEKGRKKCVFVYYVCLDLCRDDCMPFNYAIVGGQAQSSATVGKRTRGLSQGKPLAYLKKPVNVIQLPHNTGFII